MLVAHLKWEEYMTRWTSPRLLIVPGLYDSPQDHWQTWLETSLRPSLRVTQHDWSTPDLQRWSARVASTVDRAGPGGAWLVVAHSFGVLAAVHALACRPDLPVAALLLVAPADPDKFGLAEELPHTRLTVPTTLVLSSNDPWLSVPAGQRWVRRWGANSLCLPNAGHINPAAGFKTLPSARRWVLAQQQRLARERRLQHDHWAQMSVA